MRSGSRSAGGWRAGADGFKSRWFVVLRHAGTGELRRRIVATFAGLLHLDEAPEIVAVDIPIGLPQVASAGGRPCDRHARRVLGRRSSSVFNPVGRGALEAPDRAQADALSRAAGGLGIGAHAWGLARKLREADAAMTRATQRQIFEAHPEVSFWAMRGGAPMAFAKTSAEGVRHRQAALVDAGFPPGFVDALAVDLRVGIDDFLDACAALWTAERIAAGTASRFPPTPDPDARGLDQAIWF